MKKIWKISGLCFALIMAMTGCDDENENAKLPAPTMTWEANPDFAQMDITDSMNVKITVDAPAGIKTFVVDVESDVLNNMMHITQIDLINPAEDIKTIVESLIWVDGKSPVDQTSYTLDLSALVPLINGLTAEEGLHTFTVTITDNADQSFTQSCVFRRVADTTPTMTWEANPDFAQMDITDSMNVKITVDAPAGIKTFVVDVESDVLNNMMHITQIDLINPAEDIKTIVESLIWVDGKSPVDQTSYTLDLSALVPLINGLTAEEGLHTFTVTITDNADQSFTQSCVFRRVAETTPSVSDVNLWANSATVTIPSTVTSVSYREQGTEEWIPAEASEDGTWKIAPVWEKPATSPAKNGNEVYQPKAGTGVFAGKTYDLRVGEKEYPAELVCKAGDAIPNGDMTDWAMVQAYLFGSPFGEIYNPNKEDAEPFWGCGNNGSTKELCTPDTLSEENVAAHLKTVYTTTMGMAVFAAGNLFTGDFDLDGMSGGVKFGRSYAWTARPKALRVDYKGKVGMIDCVGSSDNQALNGNQDTMRIYVAVVDWNAQHTVATGLGSAPTGVWDPCAVTSVEEGAILGFASLAITENQEDFTTVEIPFYWYDTAAKPADGNFSLVISCATNNRGDYMTGCSTNEMWIDKFEWVY